MEGGFDFVVAGAGAAGCVVAARLAESGSRSVLLLEAGPDLRSGLPEAHRDGWRLAHGFEWGYESAPDARGNVRSIWRNKLLGGTSWQTRFALRGAPADFDGWPSDWSYDDVLPWFNRLESDLDFGAAAWHGDAGPLPVTRYLDREFTDVAAAAIEALAAAGFPAVDDHNKPGAIGAGRVPMNSREGRRVTTADAYLPSDATPANLAIRSDAEVAEVVFDGAAARGVRLVGGEVIDAGHVVLCAGVYGSPAILMRSGIGPADHLRSLAIEVRVDLPGVGANLVDHPAVPIDVAYDGPMRDEPILHYVATFQSSQPADAAPDLMLWLSDPEEPDLFGATVVLLRPHSRGRVRLRSADPADAPSIELPALGEPADVERLAEGFERALEVIETDATFAETLRDEAYSLPHVVGTCAMGAVVDQAGRVHGTERLTVVDASIMPDVPSGFTHMPTIMLAERLASSI